MIALYILLGLFVLLALVMLLRLRIEISYLGGEFDFRLRLLVFKFDLTKLLISKGQDGAKDKETKPKKPEETQQTALEKLSNLRDKLELYLHLLPPLWSGLLRRIVIQKLHIRMQVSRDDAFDTAMTYGAVSAVLNSLYGLLSCIFTLKDPQLVIQPVFVPGNASFEAEAALTLRIFHINAAGLAILIRYVKHSLRKRREFKAKVV